MPWQVQKHLGLEVAKLTAYRSLETNWKLSNFVKLQTNKKRNKILIQNKSAYYQLPWFIILTLQ
jgi:hypothetical protein